MKNDTQRGSVLVIALIMILILASASVCFLSISTSRARETGSALDGCHAFYIAEAGISTSIAEITVSFDYDSDSLGKLSGTFAGGSYTVTAVDNGDRTWTLTSIGEFGDISRSVQVIIGQKSCEPFSCLAFGITALSVKGNALCDSYDSAAGTYDSQKNGDHARANGDVATNGDITVTGNIRLYGDATPGPDGTVSVSGTPYIDGSTSPAEEERPVEPYIYLSVGPDLGKLSGTRSLSAGTYRYSEIRLAGNDILTLEGSTGDVVTIYVDETISISANARIDLRDDIKAVIHHGGIGNTGIRLTGRGIVNLSRIPADLVIYSAAARNILLAGTSTFCGAVYAPRACIMVTGTNDFFGAVVGRSVDIFADNVHYDEALGYPDDGGLVFYETKFWRELPP